ncbi:cytochrome P450 [Streptomyces sp. NPDC058623]|uniref:cytochrome P450 n=1 Tax=Streptomyces sp. NPDC058623 TaxID=3346563 RepID=UPI00365EC3B1
MTPSRNPAAPWNDSTLGLLMYGYAWLPGRMRRESVGVVRTRLLGRPVVALGGPGAARFFYDRRHVVRTAALPSPVVDAWYGRAVSPAPDGDAHRARTAMFAALLKDGAGAATLAGHVGWRWREAVAGRRQDRVVFFDLIADVLARAVCDWAGLPLSDSEASELARDCTAMVDGFAVPGPRHLRARRARARQEKALADLIARVRGTQPEAVTKRSALETVAWYRDPEGRLLEPRTAAAELLDLVRPTVAVAWFATFAAHALHRWPGHREPLRSDTRGAYAVAFAHEVRRFYPFAPFVGGIAAQDLTWRGEPLAKGALVLLDLYGQNHDPALWEHPYRFDPQRFISTNSPLDHLVPQVGADPARGHRRPGEEITVAVLASVVSELAQLDFDVPEQDLTIPLSRMPTLPRSRFELSLA